MRTSQVWAWLVMFLLFLAVSIFFVVANAQELKSKPGLIYCKAAPIIIRKEPAKKMWVPTAKKIVIPK